MGDVFNSGVHWPRGSQIRDDPDRSQSANRHYRKEFHRSSAYHSYQPNPQTSGGKYVSAASPFRMWIPGFEEQIPYAFIAGRIVCWKSNWSSMSSEAQVSRVQVNQRPNQRTASRSTTD